MPSDDRRQATVSILYVKLVEARTRAETAPSGEGTEIEEDHLPEELVQGNQLSGIIEQTEVKGAVTDGNATVPVTTEG